MSKDVGTPEPSAQPYTPPISQPGEWWQPTDAPAGPLGGQPGGSAPADQQSWGGNQPPPGGGQQPAGGPPPGGQSWSPPPNEQQQWSAPQQPYPAYPGSGAPQDATGGPPQYPQGGIYNYPQSGGPQPGGYGNYPQQGYQPYGTPPPRSGSQVFSIVGFVCAVISVLFCPILFGPAGIILGIIGHTKGEPLGKWAAIAAGVGMVIGFLVGFLLFNGDLTT
ncbi:DUF4190 domain-containing protein [Nocardia brasiliensis]|uniref:DUF4190 domain-containing protein n=1 Tax=Nocardia brasiliensis TaxID=37326 RepID=UPI0004A6F4A2|nr:DUF4190 domain-containing protein [Nocardia brasiliensis]